MAQHRVPWSGQPEIFLLLLRYNTFSICCTNLCVSSMCVSVCVLFGGYCIVLLCEALCLKINCTKSALQIKSGLIIDLFFANIKIKLIAGKIVH